MPKSVTTIDYQTLAALRHQIRRFLRFSEKAARQAGLEPRQHQLLLSLKGLPTGCRPRVGEMAACLQIQHHSAVELVNRLAARGFIRRHRGGQDGREVLLSLTPKANNVMKRLAMQHKQELCSAGPALVAALGRVMQARQQSDEFKKKTDWLTSPQRKKGTI